MKATHLVACAALIVTFVAGSAEGADRAPELVFKAGRAAPVSDWAGLYAGVALGAKLGDNTWTTTAVGDPPTPPADVDASSPRKFDPAALRVGGYLGYNWQSTIWVYGFEADFAYANGTKTTVGIPGCTILCAVGAPGPGNDRSSVSMKWDASARARLGYLVMPDLLVFGTTGIAWQRVEASATCENTLTDPTCLSSPPFLAKTQTNRATLTGWTVGAGAEWKMANDWLLRGEYRYADFGTWTDAFFQGQPIAAPGADTTHYDLKARTHIVTFGLAYRFR